MAYRNRGTRELEAFKVDTEIELETDESGKISFDGFHGDYKICVLSHNDEVCLAKLHKNDKEVDVVCQS